MEQAAAKVVLTKIAKMLEDEYKLQRGIKSAVECLQKELMSMQAALEAASQPRPPPAARTDDRQLIVRQWARMVRELAYDAEDTIDSYTVRVVAAVAQGPCWPWAPSTCKARRRIAADIQRIKNEAQQASERLSRFSPALATIPPEGPGAGPDLHEHDPRRLVLYETPDRLVGMAGSTAELQQKLLAPQAGDDSTLKVVAIVGPGGIGKTTLAKLVYDKLKPSFDCAAFVSVSLNPNVNSVLCTILRGVSEHSPISPAGSWRDQEVIDRIRDVLEDKRYLIVIDDIWENSVWKLIKCILVKNNRGSKVIATTRQSNCIDGFDGITHEQYVMEPLSIEDSRTLFYYRAFCKDRCPPQFTDLSERILRRCAGLPLAIVTIACLLSGKQTIDEWSSVCNSVNGRLTPVVTDMSWILSLSYYDLPSKLKPCLLYLSIFPEDHKIEKDDLIWRWICEGFVHAEQDRNLYEVGEEYFDELVNRSMIQPVDFDAHARVQTCRVHDIVLDVIISLSTEENIATIIGPHTLPPENKIRRLSLQNIKDDNNIPQETMEVSQLRSLTKFSHCADLKLSLSRFRVLRVLDLEDCSTNDIGDIENLVHLRYLRLSTTNCVVLPKYVGNLQFLRTLDLKRTKMKELPSTVVLLRQLIRLCVDRQTQLPDGFGGMQSLEELSEVDNSNTPNLMEEVGKLCKLRVLKISLGTWDTDQKEPLFRCLCNLKELQTLHIFAPYVSLDFMLGNDWSWTPPHLRRFTACIHRPTGHIFSLSQSSTWPKISPLFRLPNWINPLLSNLSDLSIIVNALLQKDLDVLGSLPALCSLDLHIVRASARERMEVTSSTTSENEVKFRCLANFKFVSRVAGLVFRPGGMQRLLKLSLSFDVAETKYVHDDYHLGLENLFSLKAVDIRIDCRCATLWELHDVEDEIRNSIKLNPNQPTLDLRRHFVREKPWDATKEIPKLEKMKELEELNGITKIGPWGGTGGEPCDVVVPPHRLETLTICSMNDVISSLSFSYYDHDGQQHIGGPWGGCGGNEHKIHLEPSEFLTKISGTCGMYGSNYIITSLTFVTNACSYGPYGLERGDHFDIPVNSNGSIIGFFGRASWQFDSLGVYVKMRQEDEIGKFGPLGGNGGEPRDIDVPPRHLKSVTIYSGSVIDSIAFSYRDHNGQPRTAGPWGGYGGDRNTIRLGHSEFLTGVLGTIGTFGEQSDLVITSLVLVTNACSYGPFGHVQGTYFHIPMKSNGCIVGFFGRADQYVNAIGVYTKHKEEMMQQNMDGSAKIGPWGGNGGIVRDIVVPSHRLESVTIYSGGLIDSLAFSYRDCNGQHHTAGPWGGCGGSHHKIIVLRPTEYVVKVSGTIGPWGEYPNVVTSLTLVTNAATYGPFGEGIGTSFHVPLQSNGSIVGFFVRAAQYIEAIGVHTRPL